MAGHIVVLLIGFRGVVAYSPEFVGVNAIFIGTVQIVIPCTEVYLGQGLDDQLGIGRIETRKKDV